MEKEVKNILLLGDNENYCVDVNLMVNARNGSLICCRHYESNALLVEFDKGEFIVTASDSYFGGRSLFDIQSKGAIFRSTNNWKFKFPMLSFSRAVKTLIVACKRSDELFDNIQSALSRLALSPFGFKVPSDVLMNIRVIAQYHGYNVLYKRGRVYITKKVHKDVLKVKRVSFLPFNCLTVVVDDYSGKYTYQGMILNKVKI